MSINRPVFPEPVPAATQLAVLPFISAVEGYLTRYSKEHDLRVTMHRVMAREKHRYIQQVCQYLGRGFDKEAKNAGRLFPEGTGLMGKALTEKKVFRTKHYDSIENLRRDLELDLISTGSRKRVDQSAISFLAVPCIGTDGDTVLVLYVDTMAFNLFADDARVKEIVDMCHGFCRLFDWITDDKPLHSLRNFLTPEKDFKPGELTAFELLQEEFEADVPKFASLDSFNIEMISV